jgi:ABC-2 type transport system ATP-binding protein
MKQRGKTIFINSHLLSELELISDRVAILVGGRVARQGTIDELAIARQYYAVELTDAPDPALLESVRRSLGDGIGVELKGKTLEIATIDAAIVQPAIDTLRSANAIIRRVHLFRPSLEDLFIEAVGGARSAGAAIAGSRP